MAEHPFPIDFKTLVRPSSPNTFLALPAGFEAAAKPDMDTQLLAGSPEAAMEAFKSVALAAPRTHLTREGHGQLEFVQRSAIFRFPDHITAEVVMMDGGPALCVYSRSNVGHSDLGVNAKRVKDWLNKVAALRAV
jgi:uncharacterized protein (DUF1499 family)